MVAAVGEGAESCSWPHAASSSAIPAMDRAARLWGVIALVCLGMSKTPKFTESTILTNIERLKHAIQPIAPLPHIES
jgi:hypothetical protein